MGIVLRWLDGNMVAGIWATGRPRSSSLLVEDGTLMTLSALIFADRNQRF
jgi:hypothetical protein